MEYKIPKKTRNGKYKVDHIICPSKFVLGTIESIDRNLRFFYSRAPRDSLRLRINYSSVRDDNEKIDNFLDRVEERIDRFYEKVKIKETDDAAFNKKFIGIIDFFNEAYDFENNTADELSKQMPEYIKKRFIYLADRLWKLGIHPSM